MPLKTWFKETASVLQELAKWKRKVTFGVTTLHPFSRSNTSRKGQLKSITLDVNKIKFEKKKCNIEKSYLKKIKHNKKALR